MVFRSVSRGMVAVFAASILFLFVAAIPVFAQEQAAAASVQSQGVVSEPAQVDQSQVGGAVPAEAGAADAVPIESVLPPSEEQDVEDSYDPLTPRMVPRTESVKPVDKKAGSGAEAEPVVVKTTPNVRIAPKRLKDYGLTGLDAKVNFTSLEPIDVVQLIEFLAHRGQLKNLVIGQGVAGLTTKLKFDDVTVADAMEVVLSVNRLAYSVNDGIVTIMTDAEYQAQNGTSFFDHKQVRVVELKYADPTRVAAILGKVQSSIGTVVADPVTGTLVLIDTPGKIEEMKAIIEKTDIATVSRVLPTETRTFVLQYAALEEVQGKVTAVLTRDAGSMQTDVRTKTLVVTDLPHNMRKIAELISLFDKKPRQVFIEAKVVEVTLSDDFSMGVNWQHMFQGIGPRFSLRTVARPGFPATPSGSLEYNTIALGGDLSVVLHALKEIGDTKILSNPQIAVLDGQEAKIEVVEDQPYKEVALESGTTNVTGVTYLFKKVGVQLAVTPRINDEEFINVAIRPEISSISQWYDGPAQEGTPVVKVASAETTVLVKDNVTIIIGGMIKDRKDVSRSSVPILGAIPLLGRAFRHESTSVVNTETVVFLTPRLITGSESFLRMRDIDKAPKPMRGEVGESGDRQAKSAKSVR